MHLMCFNVVLTIRLSFGMALDFLCDCVWARAVFQRYLLILSGGFGCGCFRWVRTSSHHLFQALLLHRPHRPLRLPAAAWTTCLSSPRAWPSPPGDMYPPKQWVHASVPLSNSRWDHALLFSSGVASCSEGKGPRDLGHLLSSPRPHVHGHDLHQQGSAAYDRLCRPVQQEQVAHQRERSAGMWVGALKY